MVFGVYWPNSALGFGSYNKKLANIHFWTATLGLLLYVSSMWTAGITQGLMWMSTTEDGLLQYPNFLETVLALMPLYWIRLVGGTMYLAGAILCAYNVYKTARQGSIVEVEVEDTGDRHVKPLHHGGSKVRLSLTTGFCRVLIGELLSLFQHL